MRASGTDACRAAGPLRRVTATPGRAAGTRPARRATEDRTVAGTVADRTRLEAHPIPERAYRAMGSRV